MPTEKEIGGWVFPNNDHIIKMARSAGMHYSGACTLTGMESHLERFAALVAAPLQERIQLLYEQLNEAEQQLDTQYKLGMEAEREACAKVCEDTFYSIQATAAIRARGQA